jgi:hypothetical protein
VPQENWSSDSAQHTSTVNALQSPGVMLRGVGDAPDSARVGLIADRQRVGPR